MAATPDKSIERLRTLLPRMGISRVADVTGLDHVGIPVFIAIRPGAKHLSTSQGKGLTKDDAWISAVMEATESYHVENPPPHELEGDFETLRHANKLVDPAAFLSYFLVPHLATIPLKWMGARELFSDERVWIPYPMICLDSSASDSGHLYFVVSTNGLSAGFSVEQTLCHSLYELIERDDLDAWMKLSRHDRDKTQISPFSLHGSPGELCARIAAAGLNILIWAVSTDAIHTFRCAIYESKTMRRVGVAFGSCAHFSKETALTKAILEAIQGRVVTIAGSRDDLLPDYYHKIPPTERLNPLASSAGIDYSLLHDSSGQLTYQAQLNEIKVYLRRRGIREAYWFDHTKPELNVSVAQVFVPALGYSVRRI